MAVAIDKYTCPFCGKRSIFVGVHDDEGNYKGRPGCEYESNPWSGLCYAIHHDGWGDCILCTDAHDLPLGGCFFDTAEDAFRAIPTLTQPNETPPCYQPDGDGCAYQCYDGQDEPIEKCKACPLCCSDKQRHYTPPNKLKRAGLYGKYTVLKNEDGSLVTNCFVLRPEKDPAAVTALRAYAAATDNAELADDIINWVGAEPNVPLTLEQLREMDGEPVWVKCLKSNEYINPPTGWRILEKSLTGTFGVWDGEDSLIERNYGTDWLAYRCPPEEEV